MKTLLALLLLIPSLSWGDEIKFLYCKTHSNLNIEFDSRGVMLNTNTKQYTSYYIRNANSLPFVNTHTSSKNIYSETADYLKFQLDTFGLSKWAVNRKNLSFVKFEAFKSEPTVLGRCTIVSSEQIIINNLENIINENLSKNKI